MTQKTLLVSNNKTVTYSVFGDGEELVFIHGVGMQAMAWQPQIEHFKKYYKVIAINMAGHNGSDSLEYGAMLPDFVSWFNDVFDALGLKKAIVLGHSMGALITQGFAVEYPEKVKSIALLNIVSQRDPEAKNAVQERAKSLTNDISTVDKTLSRWFDGKLSEKDIKNTVKEYLLSVDKIGYQVTYNAFANGDDVYTKSWGNVKCNVLLLTGELDKNSNPDMSKKLGQMIPNSWVEIISGHKHMVNLTAPNETNQIINEWLSNTN